MCICTSLQILMSMGRLTSVKTQIAPPPIFNHLSDVTPGDVTPKCKLYKSIVILLVKQIRLLEFEQKSAFKLECLDFMCSVFRWLLHILKCQSALPESFCRRVKYLHVMHRNKIYFCGNVLFLGFTVLLITLQNNEMLRHAFGSLVGRKSLQEFIAPD